MDPAGRCRTHGLPSFFISCVESGEEVPSLAALEKWAAALGVPVHQLFFATGASPSLPNLPGRLTTGEISKGVSEGADQEINASLPKKIKTQ